MGVVRNLFDGLTNALTGAGGSNDPRSYNRYCFVPLDDQSVSAAFRASWLMRKIVEKPAQEMTREGRDWQTDKANIEKLEAEEKRLNLKAKLERAEILRGLGGAGMVIFINGDDQSKPIDPERVKAGGITTLHVWRHTKFTLGEPIETWGDPWFGEPSYYKVRLRNAFGGVNVKFHPSRVVAFRAHAVPDDDTASWTNAWWGDSTIQVVKDAVDNVHTGEDGFAALIKDTRNRRLGVPGLTTRLATKLGEDQFSKRVSAMALGESMFGVTFYDSGDSEGKGGEKLDDRQMVWAGIPDIKASNLMVAAAAARIPATVLIEKAPDGMNASGAGDNTNWEKEVKSRQDVQHRPCLDRLDIALVPSALGKPDPAVWWKFAPLSTPDEKVESDTFKTSVEAINVLQQTGTIPEVALSKGVQNFMSERGYLPGLDEALSEIPEDERFPEAAPELDANGNPIDPSNPVGNGKEADPNLAPGGGDGSVAARRRAANDAMLQDWAPKTLYVRRDVINRADIVKWAKSQGFTDIADDLHVTVTYSRNPVDWFAMGESWRGKLEIEAGGPRMVEALGPDGKYKALLFTAYELVSRNQDMRDKGASFDWPEYQPHISIQVGGDIDLATVKPYLGKIVLGPEIFEEVSSGGD